MNFQSISSPPNSAPLLSLLSNINSLFLPPLPANTVPNLSPSSNSTMAIYTFLPPYCSILHHPPTLFAQTTLITLLTFPLKPLPSCTPTSLLPSVGTLSHLKSKKLTLYLYLSQNQSLCNILNTHLLLISVLYS